MRTRSTAFCGSPDMRAAMSKSSDAPRPESGGKRDEEAWIRLPIVEADASEGDGKSRIESEPVEVDASAAADRIEMVRAGDDEQLVEIVDPGVVPESVGFDSRLVAR